MLLQMFRSSHLYATAFFSGAISLICQLIALRLSQQQLSLSDLTVAAVLVSALLGLSFGAFLQGRFADRLNDSRNLSSSMLIVSAMLVGVVATFGRPICRWITSTGIPLELEAPLFAVLCVVPVNVLLGGIVPVLASSRARHRQTNLQSPTNVHEAFGWIYSIETFGAAAGALGLTFFAVPQFGLTASTLGIALAAAAVGVFGLLTAKTADRKTTESRTPPQIESDQKSSGSIRWLLLVAAIVSSCASLGMELVWHRYLAIVFGSDSQSYAIVTAVFLIGISIGSMQAAYVLRSRQANAKLYSWLLLLVAIAITLSLWVLSQGFQVQQLRSSLSWLGESPLLARLVLASMVLAAPAILMGMALPVLVRIWVGHHEKIGTRIGEIYGCVIFGNVVGVLLCAACFIPLFGLKGTAILLAAVCILVSTCIRFSPTIGKFEKSDSSKSRWLARSGFAGGILLVFGFSSLLLIDSSKPGLEDESLWPVDYYVEGPSHTVAVVREALDPTHQRLLVDGVAIGECGGGVEEKQQVLAHLPFLIGKAARPEVLTIGLGTGLLAAELVEIPQVESVTCLELSDSVIEAASFFAQQNREVLQDEKLTLIHGDGVRFLRSTGRNFDVIVSDGKSRPGASSNLTFFSREYYQLCAQRLSPDGLFVQWVSLHSDQKELETILLTFEDAFPHGYLAIAAPDSVYLVGQRQSLLLDRETMQQHLRLDCASSLRAFGWADADDFCSMGWIEDDYAADQVEHASRNTFDHPVLESYAWDSFRYSVTRQRPQMDILSRLLSSSLQGKLPIDQIDDPQPVEFQNWIQKGRFAAKEIIAAHSIIHKFENGWLDKSTSHIKSALSHLPDLSIPREIEAAYREILRRSITASDQHAEYSALINLSELKASSSDEEARIAQILVRNGRADLALEHSFNAVRKSPKQPQYRVALGEACFRIKKYSHAIRHFDLATKILIKPENPAQLVLKNRAKLLTGVSQQKIGQIQQGEILIKEALEAEPDLQAIYDRFVNL